jgi:hypothetical protein
MERGHRLTLEPRVAQSHAMADVERGSGARTVPRVEDFRFRCLVEVPEDFVKKLEGVEGRALRVAE